MTRAPLADSGAAIGMFQPTPGFGTRLNTTRSTWRDSCLVCAAWDYGVPPSDETIRLFADWREVFDRFPFVTSPAYHALRQWFRWAPVPVPPGLHPPTPRYREDDRLDGRGEDPCEAWI